MVIGQRITSYRCLVPDADNMNCLTRANSYVCTLHAVSIGKEPKLSFRTPTNRGYMHGVRMFTCYWLFRSTVTDSASADQNISQIPSAGVRPEGQACFAQFQPAAHYLSVRLIAIEPTVDLL